MRGGTEKGRQQIEEKRGKREREKEKEKRGEKLSTL